MIISFNNLMVGKIIFSISEIKGLKLRKIVQYLVGASTGAGVQKMQSDTRTIFLIK